MVRITIAISLLLFLLFSCKTHGPIVGTQIDNDTTPVKDIFQYPLQEVSFNIEELLANNKSTSQNSNSKVLLTRNLYAKNNYLPIWTNDTLINKAIKVIGSAKEHGLTPRAYNYRAIDSLSKIYKLDSNKVIANCTQLEILISQSLLKLSKHVYNGILKPETYHPSWNYLQKPKINFDSLVSTLAKENRIDELLMLIEPSFIAYTMLKEEFKRLIVDTIKNVSSIEYPEMINRLGDSNKYVHELKVYLADRGEYPRELISYKFDTTLLNTIISIQNKHGLTPDGLPGRNTYLAINWSKTIYENAIRLNMERLRWYPNTSLPNITVNIPEHRLFLKGNDSILSENRVIVGRYKNQTPVLSSTIDYIVFNPCWTVPHSIASKKMLPRIKKDTNYLDNRNMFITKNGERINHHEVDFSEYNENNFPYKIFQNTGPGNALGKVKFMFANQYSIYLHDTPSKYLFKRDNRALSHGCVRVSNAQSLAEIILKDIDKNPSSLIYYYSKGYPEKVYLTTSIKLSIQYLTCSYNEKINQVQFFSDIYGFDKKLLEDLNRITK